MKKNIFLIFVFLEVNLKIAYSQDSIKFHHSHKLIAISSGIYFNDSLGYTYSLHPNGTIQSIGKMVEKRKKLFRKYFYKDGIWKYYSIDNKLIKEEYYERNKLIKEIEY